MRRRVWMVVGAVALLACGGTVRIEGASDLGRGQGKEVRLTGKAVNARLAAMVDGEGFTVYFMPYAEWPAELEGKQVEVTGVLEQTDQYQARVGPDGAHTAGTGGGDWVVRQGKARALGP